jgi:hypothetical protein
MDPEEEKLLTALNQKYGTKSFEELKKFYDAMPKNIDGKVQNKAHIWAPEPLGIPLDKNGNMAALFATSPGILHKVDINKGDIITEFAAKDEPGVYYYNPQEEFITAKPQKGKEDPKDVCFDFFNADTGQKLAGLPWLPAGRYLKDRPLCRLYGREHPPKDLIEGYEYKIRVLKAKRAFNSFRDNWLPGESILLEIISAENTNPRNKPLDNLLKKYGVKTKAGLKQIYDSLPKKVDGVVVKNLDLFWDNNDLPISDNGEFITEFRQSTERDILLYGPQDKRVIINREYPVPIPF